MKILTITLNPCIDATYQLDSFNRGGTNRAKSVSYLVGGKGVNVSNALLSLGEDIELSTFMVIGGENGNRIKQLVSPELNPIYYEIASNNRTCHKIKVVSTITELTEPSPSLQYGEIAGIFDVLSHLIPQFDCIALSGSSMVGIDDKFCYNLIALAPSKFYLDASGDNLVSAVKCSPYCVKPNEEELKMLSSGDVSTRLLNLFAGGIKMPICTLGSNGAMYVHRNRVYHAKYSRPVTVASTVGAGDSFLAGCMSYHGKTDTHAIIRHAIACATASVIIGKNGNLDKQLVKELTEDVILV